MSVELRNFVTATKSNFVSFDSLRVNFHFLSLGVFVKVRRGVAALNREPTNLPADDLTNVRYPR
jgi:hypothetical protein